MMSFVGIYAWEDRVAKNKAASEFAGNSKCIPKRKDTYNENVAHVIRYLVSGMMLNND